MSSRVNTEKLSGSSNPSALDPSEINMFTVEYMASTEPWIFLPEEHLDTPENPRPEFCLGLGMDTIEQLAEFGVFLNPDQAAAIKVHPEISSMAAKRWIEALCGLQKGTIENEFAYSKEAEFVLSLGNTRDGIDLESCADYREKIEIKLEELKWPNPVLKWYITDEKLGPEIFSAHRKQ